MSQEKPIHISSGWGMLAITLLLLAACILVFITGVVNAERTHSVGVPLILLGILGFVSSLILLAGHLTLQPNEACLYTLFGSYVGTVRDSGFWWANPFRSKRKLSLRSRNFESAKLKVNDKHGNPIEIAAVVVWRVAGHGPGAASTWTTTRSTSRCRASRPCATWPTSYAYDHGEEHEITLRSGVDEVSQALTKELQERLAKAGVHVEEARLTHLAYAPEIAQAMLRRQQAEAVIAARQKIVHGAVSMVRDGPARAAARRTSSTSTRNARRPWSATCSSSCAARAEVHPVVNAGTLYT